MTVGAPTELNPWLVYVRVRDAIQAATALRGSDELLGNRTTPSPLLHRRFRLDPQRLDFKPPSRARPGDVVLVTETVTIVLSHDLDQNAAESSYQLAALDFVDLIRAVLTRTEISTLGAPVAGSRVIRQVGHTIEQQLALELSYHITLPEAS